MRTEDTAGNIYIKPENCDCGLIGGCEKCRGYWYNRNNKITIIPQNHYWPDIKINIVYPENRCPNCGKILKVLVCGEED